MIRASHKYPLTYSLSVNLELLLKWAICPICNNPESNCICPKSEGSRLIMGVTTKKLSRSKTVTVVNGRISMEHYTKIKAALGTGGKWSDTESIFRGDSSKRVIRELKRLNYEII